MNEIGGLVPKTLPWGKKLTNLKDLRMDLSVLAPQKWSNICPKLYNMLCTFVICQKKDLFIKNISCSVITDS